MFAKIIFGLSLGIYIPDRELRIIIPQIKGNIHKSIYREPEKLRKKFKRTKYYIIEKIPKYTFEVFSKRYLSIDLEISDDSIYELTDGMNMRINNNELQGYHKSKRKSS